MKIVIDLSEYDYDCIKADIRSDETISRTFRAVNNGILLREQSDDLIDRVLLKSLLPTPIEDEYKTVYKIIDSMPAAVYIDTEGDTYEL